MNRVFLFACALGLTFPVSANTFLFTAELDDGDAPANGLFTITLRLVDQAGTPLWSEQQPNVVVADGFLALDVGAAEPLPSAVPLGVRLVVTIEDDELPPVPLAAIARANRAVRADRATTAQTTDALAGVTAQTAARRSQLVGGGVNTVDFSNVTGVPADIANGDNGTVVTSAGQGLFLDSGALKVSQVPGEVFGTQQIPASRFAAGSIASSRVAPSAVTNAKIGTDISRADFAAGFRIDRTKVSGTSLFRVTANCQVPQGTLMTSPSCPAKLCDPTLPFRQGCSDTSSCAITNPSTCSNSATVGLAVSP